ncbi:hypothetical protein K1719_043565 [Acacia pycnantha]|nr:hypothetical protein K1719_043565 [Acacia pycnantha]
MRGLENLTVEGCGKLVSMEESREEVKKPRLFALNVTIELRKCNISDKDLPFILYSYLVYMGVKILDLSGNNFTTLPACIKRRFFLLRLVLNNCKHLIQIEGIPLRIKHLEALGCTPLSSESRNLLLTEESLRSALTSTKDCVFFIRTDIVFCMSGSCKNAQECFHHQCRGSSISFWFRNEFPMVSLCSVSRSRKRVLEDNNSNNKFTFRHGVIILHYYMEAVVLINGRKVTTLSWHKAAPNEHVMVVCDLNLHGRSENEWDHVKIVYRPKSKFYVIDNIGVTQDVEAWSSLIPIID